MSFVDRFGLWSEAQQHAARDVVAALERGTIDVVRFSFPDQHGILRGKTLVAKEAVRALKNGVTITTTMFAKDTSHRTVFPVFTSGGGFNRPEMQGAADVLMVADPLTFKVLPWAPNTGWLLCDTYFHSGMPVPFDTRNLFRKTLAKLHDAGFELVTGLEVECHVFKTVQHHMRPEDAGQPGQPGVPPDVELIDAAKIPYGRYLAQERINELLIEHARQGRFVVRLKGGDPFVFGRGGEEMLACARAGIPVTVVPGITSAVGVPAVAGVPVTHRGVTQEFHVISVHVPPGHPQSTVDWPALARSHGTLILLMAVERIAIVADTLLENGRSPETPVMVVQDGTLPTQRAVTATLDTVAERATAAGIRPPAIVIVGEVVRVGQEIEMVRAERIP